MTPARPDRPRSSQSFRCATRSPSPAEQRAATKSSSSSSFSSPPHRQSGHRLPHLIAAPRACSPRLARTANTHDGGDRNLGRGCGTTTSPPRSIRLSLTFIARAQRASSHPRHLPTRGFRRDNHHHRRRGFPIRDVFGRGWLNAILELKRVAFQSAANVLLASGSAWGEIDLGIAANSASASRADDLDLEPLCVLQEQR